MNSGAYMVAEHFPEFATARKVLAEVASTDWVPTIPDGPYKSDGWRVVKIIDKAKPTAFVERHPDVQKLLSYFECPIIMAVFYSMLPGSELHAHRDSTGTLELGRLRFHVPIETNPGVRFEVARKPVVMKTGELWALNTSYLHAVENKGSSDRVHLVLEVEANEWCWSKLPRKTLRFYAHGAFFMTLVVLRTLRFALTDFKGFRSRLHIGKFVAKRLIRRRADDIE